ncbi:septum formation initiator family protein, partial [Tomitella cavernea]
TRPGTAARPGPSARSGSAALTARASSAWRRISARTEGSGQGMSPRRVVVVIVMVCFLALALANPVRTYFTQRQDAAEAAAHHAELVAQIAELKKKEKLLEDPDYIRAQARDRLGFVEAGRTPYIVELPGDPVEAQVQHDKAEAANRPWYGSVWDSISHAAEDDADVPVPNVIPAPAPPPGG